MKVFINAVALKVAGTKAVLKNFMQSLSVNSYGNEYYFFIPESPDYEKYKGIPHFTIRQVPEKINKAYFRYYIDHVFLVSHIRKIKPDVIFSMGNIALPVSSIPQVVLFHIPHVIYPKSPYWQREGARNFFFSILKKQVLKKFRYADIIAAQTQAAKNRLGKFYGLRSKTVVVPNAVSLVSQVANAEPCQISVLDYVRNRPAGSFVFLCLSRYYNHKNLEILVEVATRIKDTKRPYKIILTIEANQGKGAQYILDSIKGFGLQDILINLGVIPMQHVPELYRLSDALVLPTLLESFTGTYAEAAFYRKPVFTSDYDFAHDVLGNDAVYFNPLSAQDIMEKLDQISDTKRMEIIREGAYTRISNFPTWPEVAKMYVDLLAQAVKNRSMGML